MEIRNNQQLISELSKGKKFKYVYFWGHQNNQKNVNKSCFSQWYESSFEVDGNVFLTAEHFMMHAKALLFKDLHAAEKILNAKTPGEAKAIGREIGNFQENMWLAHRFDIVVKGNLAKFSSNIALSQFLINTGDRILVEASPVDKIWGIGLAQDCSAVGEPTKWQGLNLLGYALMEVRKRLLES